MLASTSGTAVQGVLLLVTYSLGLGIPFLVSALLLEQLSTAFAFIKRHYRIINLVSGMFLILTGLCIALGWMDRLLALFS
jgi:cytochrome c-type biogenesis protein